MDKAWLTIQMIFVFIGANILFKREKKAEMEPMPEISWRIYQDLQKTRAANRSQIAEHWNNRTQT